MWPLYKINIKGGQELQVESTYLSHPLKDTVNEASWKEPEAKMFAKTATEAIGKAEEAMAVTNEARLAAEKAAQ